MGTLGKALTVLCLLLLSGCAAMQSEFETPTVTVNSFHTVPSDTMAPKFVIGLHVINPNRRPLKLEGLLYSVSIEGRKLLNGAASDLPTVPAYGEANISVNASADLFGGFRLLADLLQTQRESFKYELAARLDLGGFYPYVHIREEGEINLMGGDRTR